MFICNDIVVIEYDERKTGLPNAPLHMRCNNNRSRDIAKHSA
tara:strand:+ start:381 stop:506 length:126 start_codon:yes stop_codon:yes gene_type:complete